MFTKLPVYNYDSDDSDVTLYKIPSSSSSKLIPLQSEQVDNKNRRPLRRSLSSEEPEFPAILPEHPNFQYARKTFSSNKENSVLVNIGLKTLDTHNSINIDSLLDCGASGLFIDKQFIELNDITTRKLPRPIPIYNVDGTLNEGGTIKEAVDLIVSHGNRKNVPPSGSVVSEQIESFLVFLGYVSTIPLSIGPLAKLNYLAAQDLVDTFTPKTKRETS